MSYISHEDFKNLMSKFQAETPKGMLKEGDVSIQLSKTLYKDAEKGEVVDILRKAGIANAGMSAGDSSKVNVPSKYKEVATKALAKAGYVDKSKVEEKKELTPKQKKFAALAPPEDEITYADRMAGIKKGKKVKENVGDVEKVFEKLGPTLLKALTMRTKDREDIDAHDATKASLETIAKNLGLDPTLPYMEDEMFSGIVSPTVALEHAKEMFTAMLEDNLEEYGYADQPPAGTSPAANYPESWSVRESGTGDTPIDKMTRKEMIDFLGTTEEKAEGMSDEELRDEVIEKSSSMEEGIHTPPLQATGQTIDTVEEDVMADSMVTNPGAQKQMRGEGLNLKRLTTDERKQLQEFVEAIHTTKKAVEELLEKASGKKVKVKETMGGNRTGGNLALDSAQPVSEDAEGMVSPKLHDVFKKLIKALKAEGLDDKDIQMFIKYEMEQIGKEAVAGQYDPH